MSVSIDGKFHRTTLRVKYGQEFPKRYSSRKFYSPDYGNVLVYIVETGRPEWAENMTVKVPIKYYITQIYDDEHKVTKNKNKLQLVKG